MEVIRKGDDTMKTHNELHGYIHALLVKAEWDWHNHHDTGNREEHLQFKCLVDECDFHPDSHKEFMEG